MTAPPPRDPHRRGPRDTRPDDTGADDTALDEGTLDQHLEAEHDPLLGDTLRALLSPTGDVRSRAADKVDRTLQSRSIVSTLTDLSAVGWVTLTHLLTNPADTADRKQRNEDRDD
jgi:hypothetical protein